MNKENTLRKSIEKKEPRYTRANPKSWMEIVRLLADRYGGWDCYYCGRALAPVGDPGYRVEDYFEVHYFADTGVVCASEIDHPMPEVEHLTPKSRGGSNYISNLALACSSCNNQKNNKTEQEYADWLKAKGLRYGERGS